MDATAARVSRRQQQRLPRARVSAARLRV